MSISLDSKVAIYKILLSQLDRKIEHSKQTISSAIESRDDDSKSTVGDKYETNRAMMQIEIENNQVQLKQYLQQKTDLLKVDLKRVFDKVDFGSLVETNQGVFFFSIGAGLIKVNSDSIFAITLVSPIGKSLLGKKKGEMINFQNRDYQILHII